MADLPGNAYANQFIEVGMQRDQVTPNGWFVRSNVAVISSSNKLGVMEPQAMTPNPPAFESAETRFRSESHVMAPPMMA